MKKIVLVLSLISVISLVACGNEEIKNNDVKSPEVNVSTSGEVDKNANYITFKYTSIDDLKSEGVVPEIVNEGKYYDVGSVKLGNKIYDVKFISEKNTDEYYEGEFIEEKLVFFDGENSVRSFVLKTENGLDDYSKEISIFKDKYIVTVSDNGAGDSLQSLNIYDENLEAVHVKYIDGTEDNAYIDKFGNLRLHVVYENCYVINNDDITYIRNESTDEKFVEEKVTVKVIETNEGLGAEIIERTKDGVIRGAGAAM